MHPTSWRRSIQQAAKEFQLTSLPILEGSIPKSLNGSLYRNGPARLERGGQPVNHWFDGDGAILGIHFRDGQARGTQRYVQTQGYKDEEAANKFLYSNYGMPNPGPFWKVFTGTINKNSSNTSVLPLPDRLLSVWEGGWPHALDLETLETIGIDNLSFLGKDQSFSAHPKVDPVTGEFYNIGQTMGGKPHLCLYKCDKTGKKVAETRIPHRMNLIHDFTLAGRYIVVLSFATQVQGLLGLMLGYKSYGETLKWSPSLGTEVFIIDRNDLSLVSQFKTDPFYAYHYTNGYEEKDGSIYIEFVKYKDHREIDDYLARVPNLNDHLDVPLKGKLSYMRIDPKQGKMIEMKEISDQVAEFPSVADAYVGSNWRYSLFGSAMEKEEGTEHIWNAIGRYDRKNQKIESYSYGKNNHVSEPLLVSSEQDPEKGHILAVVYNSKDHKSELWVHDSENFEKDPICRIGLPEVIAPGFHGRWKQN